MTGNVYRTPLIPAVETNALSVQAASLGLLHTLGIEVVQGRYLNAATAQEPVAVLGSAAAQRLGIDHIYPGERIWVADQWFYLAGILGPSVLTPEIESSVLVGFPAAERYLQFNGHPNTVYLRAQNSQVAAVQSVLAATANPEAPNEVNVSQPSATLTARADAQGAFNGLFLGLGAVALLVGAVGVANIMVISRARTPLGDRAAPRARRDPRADPHPVPVRGDPARARRRRRRCRRRRARDRDLRLHQGLGDRHPHARLGRRVRRGDPDRRRRRPGPRAARRAALTHRSTADRVNALTAKAPTPCPGLRCATSNDYLSLPPQRLAASSCSRLFCMRLFLGFFLGELFAEPPFRAAFGLKILWAWRVCSASSRTCSCFVCFSVVAAECLSRCASPLLRPSSWPPQRCAPARV